MPFLFKLSQRVARLRARAVLLAATALVGCSSSSTSTACIQDGTYSMAETRAGGTCGALPSDSLLAMIRRLNAEMRSK